MLKVPVTAMLNSISAWWHMLGVLIIVAVLIMVPDNHKSFGYVFRDTLNNTGFSGSNFGDIMFLYVFITGLLMAQYTITGYDASAHMSEETRQASLGAAWGYVLPPSALQPRSPRYGSVEPRRILPSRGSSSLGKVRRYAATMRATSGSAIDPMHS